MSVRIARVKHASLATIAALEPLLSEVRLVPGIVERKPGTFYRKGSAFLHFHDDAAGTFADLKAHGAGFERTRVTSPGEQAAFLERVRAATGCTGAQGKRQRTKDCP